MKKIKKIISSLLVIAMICTFVPFDQLPKGILGGALSSLANYIKVISVLLIFGFIWTLVPLEQIPKGIIGDALQSFANYI